MSFNRKFKPATIARHAAERIANTHNRRCQLLADTADAARRDKAGPESIFHELLAENLARLEAENTPEAKLILKQWKNYSASVPTTRQAVFQVA